MKQQEPKTRVAIAMGSNIGDRLNHFKKALTSLKGLGNDFLYSSLYETRPVDSYSEEPFLNAVISFSCALSAPDLLTEMQRIEQENNRKRTKVNAARTLDLDLLFFGQQCFQSTFLTLPHPKIKERMFVMLPLLEVWPPESFLPGSHQSLHSCLKVAQEKDHQSQPIQLNHPNWSLP